MPKIRSFFIMGRLVLLYIAGTLFFSVYFAPMAVAENCQLQSSDTSFVTVPVAIDGEERELAVLQKYSFEAAEPLEGEAATDDIIVTEQTSVIFPDFTDIYKQFVKHRIRPKDECDVVKSEKWQTSMNEDGVLLGAFLIYYEDHKCMPIRFFQPITRPGVEKDPQSYLGAKDMVVVRNAFFPKAVGDDFEVEMVTSYKDKSKKEIFFLERLYKEPLEDFLQSEGLEILLDTFVSGLDVEKDALKGFTVTDMNFDAVGREQVALNIFSKQRVLPDRACQLNAEINDK